MYKKETADKKHHTNPYRAVNYIRDENGNPICPNGRKFLFKRKQHVRYKKYGRTEEIYPSLLSRDLFYSPVFCLYYFPPLDFNFGKKMTILKPFSHGEAASRRRFRSSAIFLTR